MMKFLFALALGAALPLPAYAEVAVTEPWARATILVSRPGAAYLTLESDVRDALIGATTPVAGHVTLHATETDAGGVGRMRRVEVLDLQPGEVVTLTPGHMHLMLMDLQTRLVEGSSFPLTLSFENAGEVTVDVPVLGVAAAGPEEPAQ